MIFFGVFGQGAEEGRHQQVVVPPDILMNSASHKIGRVFTDPDIPVNQAQNVAGDALDA